MNKPLTEEILKNFDHPVTQKLLYIYSMETFIYSELKKASLKKDDTRIPTLGPYAAALSYIV
jgi:hypothetical protein